MFPIFQFFVVVILVVGLIIFFRKIRKNVVAGLIACLLLSVLVANGVLSMIPLPTDEVIVTATGDKNDWAGGNEVSIQNYLVGGKEYEIKNPTQGKWFWQGDVYKWRNEDDPRQPEGTTKSITLQIPYGRDRIICFVKNWYSGIVEVTYRGESHQYDLYKSKDRNQPTLSAPVPDTDNFALYGAKLLRLGLFTLMIAVLMAYPVFCVIRYEYELLEKFFQKRWSKLIYVCLAAVCFWVMFESGKSGSFWLDEVWIIGWVYAGSPNTSAKIFQALYDFWFYLMPYGQEYLLIISELLVAGTIYLLGVIGELYKSKRLGIFMAAIGATSLTIMAQCGMEFCAYALLLFSATFAVYLFLYKQIHLPRVSTVMLLTYSVVLVVCMETHAFGILLAGILMLLDFFLIVKKKIAVKGLVEFILPIIYGVYWLCKDFTGYLPSNGNPFPITPPNFRGLVNTAIWLCGINSGNVMLLLFILGFCTGITKLIIGLKTSDFDFKYDYFLLAALLTPCLMLSFQLLYPAVINPGSALYPRYLTPTIPFFVFFMALALDTILSLLITNKYSNDRGGSYSVIFTTAIVIFLCAIGWPKMPYEVNIVNDYKGAAEYIMSEDGVYSPDTLCYASKNPYVNIGFEYYLSHKGERDSINHISDLLEYTTDDLKSYNTIYVVSYKNRYNGASLLRDNGFEEVFNNNSSSLNVRKWERTG